MKRSIQTVEDVLKLLDSFFETGTESAADQPADGGAEWWDRFYADRAREIPFFRHAPDESLVDWHTVGLLSSGPGDRVLELGCGPGRNAIWLAERGYTVDAIDISTAALAWGAERAEAAGVAVNFVSADIFDWQAEPYDLIYDSGCFHHLAPHRRISYTALLERCLAPGAMFGLACFAAGAMGSELPDDQLYQQRSLYGGLAYGDDELRSIFDWLDEIELRPMRSKSDDASEFGEDFLRAALFRRP